MSIPWRRRRTGCTSSRWRFVEGDVRRLLDVYEGVLDQTDDGDARTRLDRPDVLDQAQVMRHFSWVKVPDGLARRCSGGGWP